MEEKRDTETENCTELSPYEPYQELACENPLLVQSHSP